jgi:tRNA threonylcarbamoyladenosine biosynthesis protein TsaE
MAKTEIYVARSEQETIELAAEFARGLRAVDVVTLRGELGAGKSFFARHVIRALLERDEEVTSPTFNLLQIYEGRKYKIYHYDLYRLKNPEEIYELDIEEAFNSSICLIEWPQVIEAILPQDIINIEITYHDVNARKFIIADARGVFKAS